MRKSVKARDLGQLREGGRKMSLLQPNFFQFPNAIADDIMRALTPTQFICLVVIIRKTRGWHKAEDAISLSQFQEMAGIKSKKTIMRALNVLEAVGLVGSVKAPRKVTVYQLGAVFYGKNCTRQAIVKITTDLLAQNTPDRLKTVVTNTPTKEIINKKEKEKRADSAQVKRSPTSRKPPTNKPESPTSTAEPTRSVSYSEEGINPDVEVYLRQLHQACKI